MLSYGKSRGRACMAVLLLLAAAIWLFSGHAAATGEQYGEIPVVKQWAQGERELPDAVTLNLCREGKTIQSVTLTSADAAADGSWLGSFKNVPLYEENGKPITYAVTEEPVEHYRFSMEQQPQAAQLWISRWGQKITPASSKCYPIGGSNFLVANKGGNYYVWTREALSATERAMLLSQINAANLQGLGKSLSIRNTSFQSGLPAGFPEGVSVRGSSGAVTVEFARTNVWSLFYAGSFRSEKARGAVVKNTALPVSSTPTPAPTPDQSGTGDPPKTADTDLQPLLVLLSLSVSGFAGAYRRLRKSGET